MGPSRLVRAVGAVVSGVGLATTGCASETPQRGPASAPVPNSAARSPGVVERGVVARVNDGDTITLRDGRRVRLLQIDAPELFDECYGEAAQRLAERLMPVGTRVALRSDAALDERDAYGRALRYVESSGRNVNLALVLAGAAVPYFFRAARGRHASALLAAAVSARTQRRGLWGACPRARLDPALGSLTGPA